MDGWLPARRGSKSSTLEGKGPPWPCCCVAPLRWSSRSRVAYHAPPLRPQDPAPSLRRLSLAPSTSPSTRAIASRTHHLPSPHAAAQPARLARLGNEDLLANHRFHSGPAYVENENGPSVTQISSERVIFIPDWTKTNTRFFPPTYFILGHSDPSA